VLYIELFSQGGIQKSRQHLEISNGHRFALMAQGKFPLQRILEWSKLFYFVIFRLIQDFKETTIFYYMDNGIASDRGGVTFLWLRPITK